MCFNLCNIFDNGNNCCNNNCNRNRCCQCSGNTRYVAMPQFVVGGQGSVGPQGPAGPTGATGLNNSIYAESSAQTVGTGAQIPLTLSASSPTTTLTVSGNAINVPIGTYLVSFGGTALSTDGTQMGVQLYVDGTAVANQNLIEAASATEYGNVSKTVVLTKNTAGTLAIYNSAPSTSAYTNAYLTVTRIA